MDQVTPTPSNLKIVVVRATGNVGTSVLAALGRSTEVGSLVGVSRRNPTWTAPKTQWAQADVVTDDLAPLFQGADVVIHLAWLFQPTHNPLTTWRTNVLGSIRVFEAVARAGVPALVHASSVGAYSPAAREGAVDEGWPTHGWPEAAYTREKAYLERVLDTFERDRPGIRVVRLRPGFIFKREAASQQRRLLAGPLLPGRVVRPAAAPTHPATVPVLPDLPGLRFQVVHSSDVADAYRLAALTGARGAFNIAADPVVDVPLLADILNARIIRMPAGLARGALATAWHLHLVPASPQLFDAVLHLPIMDTARARAELGWSPRHDARAAIGSFLTGLREGAGLSTPPLMPSTARGRWEEVRTGMGQRA
ncbi:NAD-dependent epimerase/dehydratase family protein [Frankia sp. CcWB3]